MHLDITYVTDAGADAQDKAEFDYPVRAIRRVSTIIATYGICFGTRGSGEWGGGSDRCPFLLSAVCPTEPAENIATVEQLVPHGAGLVRDVRRAFYLDDLVLVADGRVRPLRVMDRSARRQLDHDVAAHRSQAAWTVPSSAVLGVVSGVVDDLLHPRGPMAAGGTEIEAT